MMAILLTIVMLSALGLNFKCSAQGTCAFDPCWFPDVCSGKTCVLADDCTVTCICDVTSTSLDCKQTVTTAITESSNTSTRDTTPSIDNTTTVSVTSTTVNTTGTSCPCVHGFCTSPVSSGSVGVCVCETGWSGDDCSLTCTLACQPGYVCFRINDYMTACRVDETGTRPTTPTLTSTTDPPRAYNVCDGQYQLRPESERICQLFECKYGVCRRDGVSVYCECDPGGEGERCNKKCCRQCGDRGTCHLNFETNEEACNCDTHYKGDGCSIYDPPKATTVRAPLEWYIVAGIILGALIAVAVPCIIIMWFMYKRRVILMMRFIHQFKGYEDDDERDWDAFISYKCNTTDETWVISTLFPKLTQMGFNINVHFKDFVPGHTITDGIINAIDHSRRTILVISPNYMKSNFTRFEWEKAQQKMIERKNRIIPILLEDISGCKDTMDTNLKDILESITYIQWPSAETDKAKEKFWKRIQLSMPKKKNTSSESGRLDSHVKSSERLGHENGGMTYVTSPESVNITLNGTRKIPTIPDQAEATEVYNTLNENEMLQPEDLYNTLNEATMDSSNPRFDKFGNNSDKPKCVNTDKTPDIKTEGHPVTYSQSTEIPQSLNSESKHKQNDYLNILNLKVQV